MEAKVCNQSKCIGASNFFARSSELSLLKNSNGHDSGKDQVEC